MFLTKKITFLDIFGYFPLGWGGFHEKTPPLEFQLTRLKNIASVYLFKEMARVATLQLIKDRFNSNSNEQLS